MKEYHGSFPYLNFHREWHMVPYGKILEYADRLEKLIMAPSLALSKAIKDHDIEPIVGVRGVEIGDEVMGCLTYGAYQEFHLELSKLVTVQLTAQGRL